MIEEILPTGVVAAEAYGDRLDVSLFPDEEAALHRAVEKRRREFRTGRACAREALEGLGLPAVPIPSGRRGEPCWPHGIVGSITHCDGYRACALGRTTDVATIGIDAEPNEPLPNGVLGLVARPEELLSIRSLFRVAPEVRWDRLLFSAKESLYKAWFPLMGRWLDFEDAAVDIDSGRRTFVARLLVPGPIIAGRPQTEFHGRWLIGEGLVLAAIVAESARPGPRGPSELLR
jgi:4'-phosphopantetheinyl transferase EntD